MTIESSLVFVNRPVRFASKLPDAGAEPVINLDGCTDNRPIRAQPADVGERYKDELGRMESKGAGFRRIIGMAMRRLDAAHASDAVDALNEALPAPAQVFQLLLIC